MRRRLLLVFILVLLVLTVAPVVFESSINQNMTHKEDSRMDILNFEEEEMSNIKNREGIEGLEVAKETEFNKDTDLHETAGFLSRRKEEDELIWADKVSWADTISSVQYEEIDGQDIILCSTFNEKVVAYDYEKETRIWHHREHDRNVHSIDYAEIDNKHVIFSASTDGTVIAYDYDDEEVIWQHEEHDGWVLSINHAEIDGKNVVFSGGNGFERDYDEFWGEVIAYDYHDKEVIWRHVEQDSSVLSVHHAEIDGKDLVFTGAGDDTVLAYDYNKEEIIWQHKKHADTVRSVYYADIGDKHVIFSGDMDDTVIAYDYDEEEVIWNHEEHDDNLCSIHYAKIDGTNMIFSASEDERVIAYDYDDEEVIWQHEKHSNTVMSVHLAEIEGEDVIISGGSDDRLVAVRHGTGDVNFLIALLIFLLVVIGPILFGILFLIYIYKASNYTEPVVRYMIQNDERDEITLSDVKKEIDMYDSIDFLNRLAIKRAVKELCHVGILKNNFQNGESISPNISKNPNEWGDFKFLEVSLEELYEVLREEYDKKKKEMKKKGYGMYKGEWIPIEEKEEKIKKKKMKDMKSTIRENELDLKNNFEKYDPFEFEEKIAELYSKMGFNTRTTKGVGDYGIDVIAEDSTDKIVIQVKKYSKGNKVGIEEVQRTIGAVDFFDANRAILVTTSSFTSSAIRVGRSSNKIELWNSVDLKERFTEYYLTQDALEEIDLSEEALSEYDIDGQECPICGDWIYSESYECSYCGLSSEFLTHYGIGSNKDECFLATAVYGTPKAREIEILRIFRDRILLKNKFGELTVRAYYRISPYLAKIIANNSFLKKATGYVIVYPTTKIAKKVLEIS